MTDRPYQQFIDSMTIDFDKWHDGVGYDLQALSRLGADDQLPIETLLIGKLRGDGDWRDVEALASLPTPSALAAVVESRNHNKAKVRNYAIKILLNDPPAELEAELEALVIQAVSQGYFDMAEHLPTLAVKKALLNTVRHADSTVRVNAAALLLYLCDKAPEPFDWSQRPFFLRFSTDNEELLNAAWQELRSLVDL